MTNKRFKTYFTAGLLVLLPIMLTIIAIEFLIKGIFGLTKFLFPFLPELPFDLEIIITILFFIILTPTIGFFVTKLLKKQSKSFVDNIFSKIPFIKFIYESSKNITESVLLTNKSAFRKVVLVRFPSKDIFSIGFVTREKTPLGKDLVMVFIPQVPLPTSGMLLLVKKSDIVECNISVDEAIKIILSSGVVESQKSIHPK